MNYDEDHGFLPGSGLHPGQEFPTDSEVITSTVSASKPLTKPPPARKQRQEPKKKRRQKRKDKLRKKRRRTRGKRLVGILGKLN